MVHSPGDTPNWEGVSMADTILGGLVALFLLFFLIYALMKAEEL